MTCPKCLSKDTTHTGTWSRLCNHCGHRYVVTSHPERIPQPNPDRAGQPDV